MAEPIRVLLVDDEESFWKPMSERLIAEGFRVDVATSGNEARAKAGERPSDYQVALIDQVMGPPNGTAIMRELHRLCPGLEVIILTGWGDMTEGEAAMEMGAYRYMSKPTSNVDEIALNIRTAARLGKERQQRLSLEALVRAGQQISAAQTEDDLYQYLYEEVKRLLPSLDGFLISRHNEYNKTVAFPFCYVRGKKVSLKSRNLENGIAEFALEQKKPLLLPDGDESFRRAHNLHLPVPEIGFCLSKLVVPVFPSGQAPETINAFTYQPDVHYTQDHLALLQAFANQVAVSICNVRQLEEARQLNEAATALSTQQGREQVFRAIVKQAHWLIGADLTSLILQNEDSSLTRVRPSMPEDYFDRFSPPRQQGGITRAVIDSRQSKVIPDTSDPLVKDSVRAAGVRSMLALPLIHADQVQGVLYAYTFEPRYFSPHDIDLWKAFAIQAGAALHITLELEQRNRLLRAVVHIFRAFRERQDGSVDFIARAAKDALKIDACSLLEYDREKGEFSGRGVAGLLEPEVRYTPPLAFKSWFMDVPAPTLIPDVRQDERLRDSGFVTRERIQSEVIYPLCADAEPMGLLFASYRSLRVPSPDDMEAIGLFADLAALVMHEMRLREDLGRTQRRLEQHLFLGWVSMIETTWRHSLIQKAAAIQNDTAYLQKRLKQKSLSLPRAMDGIQETIAEIDRLAADILAAPPRVPQSWEMEAEIFPLAPLLEEIVKREGREFPLRPGRTIEIGLEVSALSGVQVRGYRRWLIYAIEALLQNARNAVALGGSVSIKGSLSGAWAEVRIQDTGAGVPESIRNLLFKERIPKEQDQAGMGIGTLLAATIIEDQDGTIELDRLSPENTTVLIRLPVAKQAAE